MKELKIILPHLPSKMDVPGASELHKHVKFRLCSLFGGVTVSNSVGVWRDNSGSLVEENVAVYVSAADAGDWARFEMDFYALARVILIDSGEECLYVVDFNGDAKVLSLSDVNEILDNLIDKE